MTKEIHWIFGRELKQSEGGFLMTLFIADRLRITCKPWIGVSTVEETLSSGRRTLFLLFSSGHINRYPETSLYY
jgi:hypothetical protein